MIKNAIAYVTRKKKRTVILFIILTVILSFLYSSLSIMKSSGELEKSLYHASNSSLSITKKDVNGYFKSSQFKNLNKIKGVKGIVYQYDGLSKLVNGKVIEAQGMVMREDLSDEMKNVLALRATSNAAKDSLFTSKVFNMTKGRNISEKDRNSIVVHEAFAKKNKLKLGDTIDMRFFKPDSSSADEKEYKYKIVGIFSGRKQETYTGLSSDFSENMVFVDYESAQKSMGMTGDNKILNKISVFSDSPSSLEKIFKEVNKIVVHDSSFNVAKDNGAFKDILESLSSIKHVISIMTLSIMAGGITVLALILILWLRERVHEIGILLSIGVRKISIVGQFITELLIVSLPAALVSAILGSLVLNKIIGSLLNNKDMGMLSRSIIDSKNIIVNLINFSQSYLLLLLVILISVVIASAMILIRKPKEILSQIS
ncbi:ABC transporter permease [Clostridiales bacterium S5-A14a]|nr:ABC transporter permease [Clostridiales bacterium S5-A14a]